MTEKVKALVNSYLGINKELANHRQQLKLTILEIKKAVEENVITDQSLKELFLTTIIDYHYPGTKLLLKKDMDENSSLLSNDALCLDNDNQLNQTEVLLLENSSLLSVDALCLDNDNQLNQTLLEKVKKEWIQIIMNQKGKHIEWQTIFPEIFDGDNVSIGQYFIVLLLF